MLDELEKKILSLLEALNSARRENERLREENERLNAERVDVGTRIDAILKRLEAI